MEGSYSGVLHTLNLGSIMTQILLNALKTDFGVPGEEDATVTIVATPWAGDAPKIRVSGQKLILPDADGLTFTGTTASETFSLVAPNGTYCWKLDVSSVSPAVAFTRFVTFPEQATIDWADLTDVDPTTFLSNEVPEPAWYAALNAKPDTADVLLKATFDAKGDLIVATADNTPARLPVGANGTVPIADSSQAAGIRWGVASSPAPAMMPRPGAVGYLNAAVSSAASAGASAQATGAVPLLPIYAATSFIATGLTVKLSVGESVPVRLLLYSSDETGHPVNLVASGSFTPAGAATYTATFADTALPAGLYWVAMRSEGGNTLRADSHAGASVRTLISAGSGAIDSSRMPLPSADVGTVAAPATVLSGWTYGGNNTIPYITIRKAG